MKLLLDANISWRLADKLRVYFDDCKHVDHTELAVPAKDIEIWEYAFKNRMIIVTNDEDFLNLINLKGFPPKIILLKTGNLSNRYIESYLSGILKTSNLYRPLLKLDYWKLFKYNIYNS